MRTILISPHSYVDRRCGVGCITGGYGYNVGSVNIGGASFGGSIGTFGVLDDRGDGRVDMESFRLIGAERIWTVPIADRGDLARSLFFLVRVFLGPFFWSE